MIKRALISGGGTGGHIFPALSIANALKRRYPDIEILFVGAENRMEMQRVPAAGYRIIGLPVSGFDRAHPLKNFKVVMRLLKSMRMARKIIRDFKPDVAIGVGGYASGPMLKAAQKQGVPTVLQEQNSYPGVTNKILAKKARAVCVAYEGTDRFFPADVIHLTGNPVRKDLSSCPLSQAQAKSQLGFDPSRPLVLAVGGSLGARTINEALSLGLDAITGAGLQLMWQIGRYGTDKYLAAAAKYPDVKGTEFINDMALAYKAADAVVSRAGAGTISELQILGKPAILVPSPNVAEDHQRKNALALADRDAAIMVTDAEASQKLAATVVSLLQSPERLATLSDNIRRMALPESDEHIVNIIEKIVGTTEN